MQGFKPIIAVITVVLTFAGYVPYVGDTLRGKTTPHVYTWFVWVLTAAITYGLQVQNGAGVGSWVTLAIVISLSFIFLLSLRSGKKDITASDTIFLLLSFAAIYLWLIAKQPVLSVILVSTIDMLAFAPTIRKSWDKPHSETLFTYQLNVFRHGLSLLALQQYSIVTWLYPISWVLANLLFSNLLVIRRKNIRK